MFLFLFLGLVFWVKGISRRKRKREKEGGKGGGCYRYGFGLVWYLGDFDGRKRNGQRGFLLLLFYFHFIAYMTSLHVCHLLLGLSAQHHYCNWHVILFCFCIQVLVLALCPACLFFIFYQKF